MTLDITTHEALIKDLTAIVVTANKGDDDLSKAKDKANNASDKSIRAIAARVATVNEELTNEAINAITESVATKIANGNANVKKARKSELKLCLKQRTHIAAVITEIDKTNEDRGGTDQPRKLNLRSATLGALRVIKADKCSPDNAVTQVISKKDHVDTTEEKMAKHIAALEGCDIFKDDGDTHPNALRAFSALSAALTGNTALLDALCEPEAEPDPEAATDELLAEQGLVQDDLDGPDPMQEIENSPLLPDIDVDVAEETAIPVEAPDEDEFDIDALTKGLL